MQNPDSISTDKTPYLFAGQQDNPVIRHDDVVKHLELIQAVINRMAGNSFLLKGWTITLVAALFALASKDAEVRFACIALLPTLAFWLLDAFFLHQEQCFRALYNHVRVLTEAELQNLTPFCMDCSKVSDEAKAEVGTWISTIKRPTLVIFYLCVLVTIAGSIWYFSQGKMH